MAVSDYWEKDVAEHIAKLSEPKSETLKLY